MLSYYEFSQLSKEKQQELVMNSTELIGVMKKNDIDFNCVICSIYMWRLSKILARPKL